jgi:hypothetical protein
VSPVIAITIVAWLGAVILVTAKMMVDQLTLFRTYRERVNPSYPIAPGDKRAPKDVKEDPLGIRMGIRQLEIIFKQPPRYGDSEACESGAR